MRFLPHYFLRLIHVMGHRAGVSTPSMSQCLYNQYPRQVMGGMTLLQRDMHAVLHKHACHSLAFHRLCMHACSSPCPMLTVPVSVAHAFSVSLLLFPVLSTHSTHHTATGKGYDEVQTK